MSQPNFNTIGDHFVFTLPFPESGSVSMEWWDMRQRLDAQQLEYTMDNVARILFNIVYDLAQAANNTPVAGPQPEAPIDEVPAL